VKKGVLMTLASALVAGSHASAGVVIEFNELQFHSAGGVSSSDLLRAALGAAPGGVNLGSDAVVRSDRRFERAGDDRYGVFSSDGESLSIFFNQGAAIASVSWVSIWNNSLEIIPLDLKGKPMGAGQIKDLSIRLHSGTETFETEDGSLFGGIMLRGTQAGFGVGQIELDMLGPPVSGAPLPTVAHSPLPPAVLGGMMLMGLIAARRRRGLISQA
jgi:hypothetical protein